MDPRIELLIQVLDQAFDVRAWHGTTLKGSIRGLKLPLAVWRPAPGRHSIWEIMVHAAYWKYAVRRGLTGESKGSFPRKGSDWPAVPSVPTAAGFKADVALLRDQHALLRDAIAQLSPRRLKTTRKGLKWRNEQYIYGAASHDLYHAGQIQLIKRLFATQNH